jgi:hypothetical protein
MSTIEDLAEKALQKCKDRIARSHKSLQELDLDESDYEISKRMKEKRGL